MMDFQKNVGPINLCFSILRLDPENEESAYRTPDYYEMENY